MREITPHLWFDGEGGRRGGVLLFHPCGVQAHKRDHDRDTPSETHRRRLVQTRWLHQPVGSASQSWSRRPAAANAALWRVEAGPADRFYSATIVAVEGWRSSRSAVHV